MDWISVIDRLPEKDAICLVWNELRPCQYYVAFFLRYCREFEVHMIGYTRLTEPITYSATHWIEIISPDYEDIK